VNRRFKRWQLTSYFLKLEFLKQKILETKEEVAESTKELGEKNREC
jgi:hypothetical protein